MMRIAPCLSLGLLLPLASACRAPAPPAHDGAERAESAAAAAGPQHNAEAAHAHDAGVAAGSADHGALPLRPIMQQLATAMAGLTQALWVEDYAAMTGHADRIAGHSEIAPAELERIDATLGPDTSRFAAADEAVHEAALELREAVLARDRTAILRWLATVQEGCVACHSEFRHRLRTTPEAPPAPSTP